MIEIRRATPADKRAVKTICAAIWSDDYLVGVFDEWVRDRAGGLWVACVDGTPVAVAKLTILADREAWLGALRVHPDFRRRGIAEALIAHRLARARRLGACVARLDTSSDNTAIKRLMRRFGFRERGRYSLFQRAARNGGLPRRATMADVDALVQIAAHGGDGLLHEAHVRRRLARSDVTSAVKRGVCFVTESAGQPAAFAIVQPHKDRLRAPHLAGRGRAFTALLRSLPTIAARMQKRRMAVAPERRHWRALRAAGYRRAWSWSMLVFEKRL